MIASALLVSAASCAPRALVAATPRFDGRAHCEALRSITDALGLYVEGAEPTTQVELRGGDDRGDAHESHERGKVLPSGFEACDHRASRHDGLNWHRTYTCAAPAHGSSRARYDEMVAAWRTCFRDSPSLRETKAAPDELRFDEVSPDPPLGYSTPHGGCALRYRDGAIELECMIGENN